LARQARWDASAPWKKKAEEIIKGNGAPPGTQVEAQRVGSAFQGVLNYPITCGWGKTQEVWWVGLG
jgi:hypothetical protein